MKQLSPSQRLTTYYANWIQLYKQDAVQPQTLLKYDSALAWLTQLAPNLTLAQLNRMQYQALLNAYATTHERSTTNDFHHHLKAALLDALDEGLLTSDPTRRVVIKGKKPRPKKAKYLNEDQLTRLIATFQLDQGLNDDWLLLLIIKTGLRFAEALALTPADFNLDKGLLTINKTWNYRRPSGGFKPTKNPSSNRVLALDPDTTAAFDALLKPLAPDDLLFVHGPVYNSTLNIRLKHHCEQADVPVITIHSLRHTHASLLLYAGVSIASVAQRLGHASITTTQRTYLHIIQELAIKDDHKMMHELHALTPPACLKATPAKKMSPAD